MMAMNMMAQMTAQTINTINEVKANRADKTTGTDGAGNANSSELSISDKVKNSKSFTELNTLEANINKSIKDFNTAYSSVADDNIAGITSSMEAYQDVLGSNGANVNLDFNSLKVTDLQLTENSDLTDLGKALETIDKDIKKVDDFAKQDGALGQALTKLDDYINDTLTIKIQALASRENSSTNPLTPEEKTQLAELRQKKNQAQQARTQLDTTVRNQVKALKSELEAKKSELEQTKKDKTDTMDKKYDLAKKLNEDITKVENDIKKKRAEIDKAPANKMQKLVGQLDDLIAKLQGYQTDCGDLAGKTVQNSKGEPATVPTINTSLLTNPYKESVSASSNDGRESVATLGGGANSRGLSGLGAGAIKMPELNMPEFKPEGTITIGNKNYIPVGQDSYMCDGQIFPKDFVLKMQMAQFAPKTEEA